MDRITFSILLLIMCILDIYYSYTKLTLQCVPVVSLKCKVKPRVAIVSKQMVGKPITINMIIANGMLMRVEEVEVVTADIVINVPWFLALLLPAVY